MKKKVLVSWSGGIDSTYLIYKYLQEGYIVDAVYINLENNETKVKTELEAIHKIVSLLDEYNFNYLGESCKIFLKRFPHQIPLTQPVIWLFGLYYVVDDSYDEVGIAYVLNDCANSWIDEIRDIWNSFRKFSYNVKLPEIKFPLIKEQKSKLFNDLPDEIIKHTVFCEQPIRTLDYSKLKFEPLIYKPIPLNDDFSILICDFKDIECGKCGCCQRRKYDEERNFIPKKFWKFRKIEDIKDGTVTYEKNKLIKDY